MRIGLFAVGRLKAGPEKDLAGRYLDRFAKAGPAVGLELARVVETAESRAPMRRRANARKPASLKKRSPTAACSCCSMSAARRSTRKPSRACSVP